jgi:23S rRNA pseudouridine1911/1915/1917 synthase
MAAESAPPRARTRRLTVTAKEARHRLDRFLAGRLPDSSRSYLQKLVADGCVRVEGEERPLKANRPVATGEVVTVTFPPSVPSTLRPEAIPLDVLHEDRHLIVINKPAGMVVHPGAGAREGTLAHAILHHCSDLSGIGGVDRPGIVHRLDKDTSGVIVVAKDDATHRDLAAQFARRTVEKTYVALVRGRVRALSGAIDAPLGRDRRQRLRISSRTDRPRDALTHYTVLERLPRHTWLEIRPRTGRTHQIRVHMKMLGHPIAGDPLYGGRGDERLPVALPRRLALHALRIAFDHPATRGRLVCEAPLPADLTAMLEAARAVPS